MVSRYGQEPEAFEGLKHLVVSKLKTPEKMMNLINILPVEEGSEEDEKGLKECFIRVKDRHLERKASILVTQMKNNPSGGELERFMNIQNQRKLLKELKRTPLGQWPCRGGRRLFPSLWGRTAGLNRQRSEDEKRKQGQNLGCIKATEAGRGGGGTTHPGGQKTGENLSVEEIDEALPKTLVAPEALDIVIQSIEARGIVIQEYRVEKGGDAAAFLENQESAEADEETAEGDGKSSDPVRLYLRKMGSVSLLTREGEVQIAQRIEAGERQIVRAILTSPVGTREIIQLGDRVDMGKLKVKALFRGLEDEETQYEEQEYIDKIHELIGQVQGYEKRCEQVF